MRGLLALAVLAASVAPLDAGAAPVERMRYAMGTLWTIEAEGAGAEAALAAAFSEIRRLENKFSTYMPDSELSRLNRAGTLRVSHETAALIDRALGYARASGGAFDPTVEPLVRLWGFKHLNFQVPAPAAVARTLRRVGHAKVMRDGAVVSFGAPGMALDLGAIAKGYAIDRALAVLKRAGMTRARVDAGGNQGVAGAGPWHFGVKHPRRDGEWLGVLTLSAGAVATSGDAERGFWHHERRYGHVLDPRTGWPAACLSVTVSAPSAEQADALSTTLAVLGPKAGLTLLRRYPHTEAAFVTAQPDGGFGVVASPGWAWREIPKKRVSKH